MTDGASPWWREAVTYEIYVRSFVDHDGDGLGDLRGLRSQLPYVRGLGVDAVWLTPFYPSPDHDAGYDVRDPRDVDTRLGDLTEIDAVIADAHSLGLQVVVDLVLNHVSSEHPWFVEARAANRGSAARSRFHVRPGRGPDQRLPPNNWQSVFGGSAWEPFGDGDFYLHAFDVEQPDVNHGHPEVAADADRTLRFWLDRGVDGVRFDAAGAMSKDPTYPDLAVDWRPGDPSPWSDREQVHDLYRRWAAVLDEYDGALLGVAEVWGSAAVAAHYLRPDEMGQAFAIDPLFLGLHTDQWRTEIETQLAETGRHDRLPAWTHGCHDVSRAASRWGPDGARAVLLLMLALPGATYVFAGDELGLPDVDLPDADRRDPTFLRSGGADLGRDGCRVPLPWTDGPAPHGFGPAGSRPWLPQPAGWGAWSVQTQRSDQESALELTRVAVALRRDVWRGSAPVVRWLAAPTGCLAFQRDVGGPVCFVNLSADPVPAPPGDVLLASAPVDNGLLSPRSTAWLRPA